MITSVTNKKIKEIHKLKENRNIKKYQKYLIEGSIKIRISRRDHSIRELY